MNATEAEAMAELYDALGAIARELALADDALGTVLGGCELELVPAAVLEARRRVERAHAVAATMRERWA